MGKLLDFTGKTFGRLTAIERGEAILWGQASWRCRCECGNLCVVSSSNLRTGHTRSCGCLHRDNVLVSRRTHGHAGRRRKSTTHTSWAGMKRRCLDPTNPAYPSYGGRGITLCERWRVFENFLADMGLRPAGTSLERIDNNGNYSPDNCRWATPAEQGLNKRNNQNLTFHGQNKCVAEWARTLNMPKMTIWSRLNRYGWSVDRTLGTPVRG